MYRSILLSVAAVALTAGTISAQAACGVPTGKSPHIRLSAIGKPAKSHADSIVGVWQVSLIVGGQTVLQTMKSWHSDGTEYDNADLPPTAGNVCQGVWVSTGPRRVHNRHIGWTFDASSNPSGYFIEVEDDKVARDGNSYSGPFDQKFYDAGGNLVNELQGTISAIRVTAD